MTIKPLFDNIVLVTPKSQTSNIILTDTQDKPDIAEVYALGTGGFVDGHEVKFEVKVGDKVLYNKYSANEFYLDNKLYILIKQCDILAILND